MCSLVIRLVLVRLGTRMRLRRMFRIFLASCGRDLTCISLFCQGVLRLGL